VEKTMKEEPLKHIVPPQTEDVEAWARSCLEDAASASLTFLSSPFDIDQLRLLMKWGDGKYARSEARWHPPRISLNLHACAVRGPSKGIFSEYKRFEKDPQISSFKSSDWRRHVAAVCAHELSHHIVWARLAEEGFEPGTKISADKFQQTKIDDHHLQDWLRPHGPPFKRIYAHLRTRLMVEKFGDLPLPCKS